MEALEYFCYTAVSYKQKYQYVIQKKNGIPLKIN